MNYTTSAGIPFTGQYYLLIKQKLAMDLNRFSVNFVCLHNNVVLRNGAYYSVQIRSYVTTCGARIELMR
jgi:hypothetical protein